MRVSKMIDKNRVREEMRLRLCMMFVQHTVEVRRWARRLPNSDIM